MTDFRRNIATGAPWEAVVGYSRAVVCDGRVSVSGTAPVGTDGTVFAPGDAYRQTQRCLEIIAGALDAAGAGLDDVVRTRIYVTDIGQWQEVGRAHGEVFGDVRPATSMVEVSGLIDPAMLVEIEAEAVLKPESGA